MQSNSEEKQVICSTCKILFYNVVHYKLHISTEYHVYNTKRKIAGLDPISEEIFDQKKATLALQSQCQSQLSEVIWKCQPCKKTFKSMEQLDQHKLSKNHKKNEKQYKIDNPDHTQSSMFQNITTDKPLFSHLMPSNDFSNHDSHDPTEEAHQKLIEDSQDSSKLPSKTTLDSLRICLFCNKESEGVKKNLDHMRLEHSFFILDVDCVISLKGLLTYIAERVQLGYLCLYCSKMFKNARRTQQHMMDKCHCFMNLADEHEYEKFYDFSKTYEGHPDTIPQDQKEKGEQKSKDKKDEEWEDVDFEDIDEEDDENAVPKQEATIHKNEGSEASFDIIDSNHESSDQKKSESFSEINPSSHQHDEKTTHPFQNITDTLSSIKDDKEKVKVGKTREEAMLGLKVKPAQLLETGEILLGNGKIIGTRSLKFIYKQRFRMEDTRESVVINKLAVEYRKIRMITNGVVEQMMPKASHEVIHQQEKMMKLWKQQHLMIGMKKGKTIRRPEQ